AILASAGFLALRRWLQRRALAALRPGAFTALAGSEVTLHGLAAAGPTGTTESRLAGVECRWHGHEVGRQYATWRARAETGGRAAVPGAAASAGYGSAVRRA